MSIHTLKVEPEHANLRVDVYLASHLAEAPSRSFVKKLIDQELVKINKKIIKPQHKVCEGDNIEVEIPDGFLVGSNVNPEKIPLDIFYEDECLLMINKVSGMVVHPAAGVHSGTLVNALVYHYDELSDMNESSRAGIVHRLDQDTSGLLIVAKDNKTHAFLSNQFQEREIYKRYIALVEGDINFDEGVIDAPLSRHPLHREKQNISYEDSAREAVTFYQVKARLNGVSLVYLYPQTGRTHQLRVHMKHLGHPILGDEKYGRKNNFPRLALHAQAIAFTHPLTNSTVEFSSSIPPEFLAKVGLKSI